MKKLDKIFLFFILLIGLCFSICIIFLFCPTLPIQEVIKDRLSTFPWLNYLFIGYGAILCLCFFILILITLFSLNQSDYLIITKSKGELQFSKKTIESTIQYSIADLVEINFSKIRIKLSKKPDNINIYVKLSLNDTKELASITETVQEKIASALLSSLGITVKSILVKVTEVNTVKKENSEESPEGIRVI